jgi:hypothetical protein
LGTRSFTVASSLSSDVKSGGGRSGLPPHKHA